ncbi:hypothetical protein T484DRAFT_1745139 [Baffinella frigidus]|nr:hypothetical protein T484DRAFT_1745139 [Cryptophyta sp. CCMP2293]
MTAFNELSLAKPQGHSEADGASIFSGENELFKHEQLLNALFKEEQFLPAGTASAATETTGDVDPLMLSLKMLPSDDDLPGPGSPSNSTLLLQLRVGVTVATEGPPWCRTHETTTSNKSPLNSAAVWNALGRRFQAANLKQEEVPLA